MNKFLFCLALLPLSVNASVTYVWENLTTVPAAFFGPRQIAFSGLMTFDDATVASGVLHATDVPQDGLPVYFSYFGLEHIEFAGHNLGDLTVQHCTDIHYDDPVFIAPNCGLLGDLVFGAFAPGQAILQFDLTFGDYLTGFLRTGDLFGNMQMHSDGNIWAVDRFTTDDEFLACVPHGCEGITGVWRRVPEPMTWTLLLLALAIMYRLRAGSANWPTAAAH